MTTLPIMTDANKSFSYDNDDNIILFHCQSYERHATRDCFAPDHEIRPKDVTENEKMCYNLCFFQSTHIYNLL